MNLMQATAAVVLWRTGQFDTHDIAKLLFGVSEADVVRLLDAARERERGPDLYVIEGGTA